MVGNTITPNFVLFVTLMSFNFVSRALTPLNKMVNLNACYEP